jgi:hypothetical protein
MTNNLDAEIVPGSLDYDQTIITKHKNGVHTIEVNGLYTYIKYNTGDQVWFSVKNGQYVVRRSLLMTE